MFFQSRFITLSLSVLNQSLGDLTLQGELVVHWKQKKRSFSAHAQTRSPRCEITIVEQSCNSFSTGLPPSWKSLSFYFSLVISGLTFYLLKMNISSNMYTSGFHDFFFFLSS